MPTFYYKAKKDSTQTVSGQINANHVDEAIDLINQLGLVPVSVSATNEQGVLISDIKTANVKGKDVSVFSRQLAGLLKSGVPLLKSLDILSQQTRHRYFAQVINEMSVGVKSGRAFSACLADYPAIFSALYVSMVRIGEDMGQLKQMLLSMADYLRKQEEFSAKVRHALVYPSVMLCVGIATVIFILTFVMPKVTVIFTNTHQQLPWPTIVVMSVSRVLKHIGLPLLIMMAAGVLFFNRWRQTPPGRIAVSKVLMLIPVLRNFILKADLARFTRTFQLLLDAGIGITKGIEAAVSTVHHPILREQLLMCSTNIIGGDSLGNALASADLVDPIMVQQITVAEESGHLPEALGDLATTYENDVDAATKSVTVLIEPLMIVAVGSIVGFIVFAMLLPIFSMDILAN